MTEGVPLSYAIGKDVKSLCLLSMKSWGDKIRAVEKSMLQHKLKLNMSSLCYEAL